MQVENSDTFDPSGLLKILEQFQPSELSGPTLVDEPGGRLDAGTPTASLAAPETTGEVPADRPSSGAGDVYSARGLVQRVEAREAAPLGQLINLWA